MTQPNVKKPTLQIHDVETSRGELVKSKRPPILEASPLGPRTSAFDIPVMLDSTVDFVTEGPTLLLAPNELPDGRRFWRRLVNAFKH